MHTGIHGRSIARDMKCENAIYVFKKVIKTEAGNFGSVSLTSLPCKVIKSVLRD